jgi:hypothetical protein
MNRDYWQLRTGGRNYYDMFRLATKISNRMKALIRDGYDVYQLLPQLELAKGGMKHTASELVKLYKELAPEAIQKFQKETPGLGELWVAMLVGVIGDFKTYVEAHWEEDPTGQEKRVLVTGETRTAGVREIWAYCGHGEIHKRQKGMTQEDALACGNPLAKMVIHIIAQTALRLNGESYVAKKPEGHEASCDCNRCLKAGTEIPRAMTPYYPHYLEWKEQAAARHPDWTKKHVDNHAVRRVAKAVLKDIWRVQHGFEPVYGGKTEWVPRTLDLQPVTV